LIAALASAMKKRERRSSPGRDQTSAKTKSRQLSA